MSTAALIESLANLDLKSHITTGVNTLTGGAEVLVNGDFGYVAGGKGLRVLDTRDKKSPKVLGDKIKTGVLEHYAQSSLAMNDAKTVLWVAGGGGLASFDIKNPQAPRKIAGVSTGVLNVTGGGQLSLHGDTLYLAGNKGLAIFDVSDPAHARRLSKTDTGVLQIGGNCNILVNEEKKTVFCIGGSGLAVFDCTDAKAPRKIAMDKKTGVLTLCGDKGKGHGGGGGGADVSGTTLFVAGGKGMVAYDVSDPAQLTKISTIKTGAGSVGGGAVVKIVGDLAYVAGGNGLSVVNISDPANMVKMGETIDTGATTLQGHESLYMTEGGLLYVVGGHGISVVDTSAMA